MSKWSHLPNAVYIDQILAHVKTNPEKWEAVRGATRDAARHAATNAATNAAWNAARDAAGYEARGAAWNEAWSRGARGAILALMAYPECAYMLNMSVEQLKMYAHLDVKGAWLLYPAVMAMEKEYV